MIHYRIKVLKRNAQAANSLTPRKENPSMVLADVVGMFIAGLAMVLSLFHGLNKLSLTS
jgi:hypothetical protein